MESSIIIVGISGSLRKYSRNTGLLRCAAQNAPAGVLFELADIRQLPLYNADISEQEKPEAVVKLVEQVARADALMLACPEYNYSMAPALKNALDWLSREPGNKLLDGKPAAILGAGGSMGTCRAQYHLRQVCVYLNIRLLNKPEIFSDAFSECFDSTGNVVDTSLTERIARQLEELVRFTKQLNA